MRIFPKRHHIAMSVAGLNIPAGQMPSQPPARLSMFVRANPDYKCPPGTKPVCFEYELPDGSQGCSMQCVNANGDIVAEPQPVDPAQRHPQVAQPRQRHFVPRTTVSVAPRGGVSTSTVPTASLSASPAAPMQPAGNPMIAMQNTSMVNTFWPLIPNPGSFRQLMPTRTQLAMRAAMQNPAPSQHHHPVANPSPTMENGKPARKPITTRSFRYLR